MYRPPDDFPVGQVITIDSGQSLQNITDYFEQAHIVRSPLLFRSIAIVLGGEKHVIAGDYRLNRREGPLVLAYRLVHGDFKIELQRILVPEGATVAQIGDILQKSLLDFSKKQFLTLASTSEGYLFPNTYFIPETTKPQVVIDTMKNLFRQQVFALPDIYTSGHSLKDILTMASILEDEARTTESRKIISGILWKRIALGMPLQVDSTFLYINGKNTFQLTQSDLKIKSPYNTYVNKGLPPTPIGNPGLDAIEAALEPTTTDYLYYLTGRDGQMHYAATFAEHVKNKQKYLN